MSDKKRVAIVGATGYTGAELIRFGLGHPGVDLTAFAGNSSAGKPLATLLPSLSGVIDDTVIAADPDEIAERADVAFCGLPHGASAGIVSALRDRGLTVFDLSADFRLESLEVYKEWYGEHGAPQRLPEAVYGLVEFSREALRSADLIAVPGCYPTASALAAAPLVKNGLVELDSIVIDAKSGASGAGRGLSEAAHFAQLAEGFRAYKVGGKHRHTSEIEQTLSGLAGEPIRVTFTPHLVPMTRGILATAYGKLKRTVEPTAITELARTMYQGSASVTVLDAESNPDTLMVRGSNRAHVSFTVDRRTSRVIAQCAIDNLVKGAAGQAWQCFNVRFGYEEGTALDGVGMFP